MTVTVASGNDIKVWRASRNLTMEQAAKLLGTTRQALHRWERGAYPRDISDQLVEADQRIAASPPPIKAMSTARAREDRINRANLWFAQHPRGHGDPVSRNARCALAVAEQLGDPVEIELCTLRLAEAEANWARIIEENREIDRQHFETFGHYANQPAPQKPMAPLPPPRGLPDAPFDFRQFLTGEGK